MNKFYEILRILMGQSQRTIVPEFLAKKLVSPIKEAEK